MKIMSTFANFRFILLSIACLSLVIMFTACRQENEMTTCDGQGKVKVAHDMTGQALADALMDQWTRDHPDRDWMTEEKLRHELKPPADNSALLQGGQADGHTYGQHTERDLLIWTRETEKLFSKAHESFTAPIYYRVPYQYRATCVIHMLPTLTRKHILNSKLSWDGSCCCGI